MSETGTRQIVSDQNRRRRGFSLEAPEIQLLAQKLKGAPSSGKSADRTGELDEKPVLALRATYPKVDVRDTLVSARR